MESVNMSGIKQIVTVDEASQGAAETVSTTRSNDQALKLEKLVRQKAFPQVSACLDAIVLDAMDA